MDDLTRKQEAKPVDLSCGHTAYFWPPPLLNDLVYCWKCDNWYRVRGGKVKRQTKRIECQDCSYARKYEMSLSDLRTRAETHMLRFGHRVMIWDEQGKVRSVTPYGPQA